MIVDIISWVAMVLSLAGNLFIAKKMKIGFVIWLISNLMWIAVNIILIHNIPQIIMYAFFTGANIYGIVNWSKEK